MIIIGLTGNIGSGKSFVSRRLRELGAQVINTDIVAREVVAFGAPALEKIVRKFGRETLRSDGTLDRKYIGAKVFRDANALVSLNAIVHPQIRKELIKQIKTFKRQKKAEPKVLVIEVPLLIEAKMQDLVDEVWLITVDEETRLKRVMTRDGLTEEEVRLRLAAQMPQEEKKAYAHRIINNNGNIKDLLTQVDKLWSELE
ncbi:dephospho-CoA kinase [Peptococcaceae bacterium SCADC1_2_3]|jgi:dephospho-CoA kinase|nr:dephospho-CoA kinase [Peptococcaceae bacterium SCADC1_2_3]KFI36680.1 dephospho-CoA kinase [Peptococcaceae bacterium SCADC1_2_3]KFI38163.1 dephospho-CoA kinase [Peptococcaceae bacterium SCADC1_2_3]